MASLNLDKTVLSLERVEIKNKSKFQISSMSSNLFSSSLFRGGIFLMFQFSPNF